MKKFIKAVIIGYVALWITDKVKELIQERAENKNPFRELDQYIKENL
jgi:hypothetical protein